MGVLPHPDVLLIAGGIGITPLYSILAHFVDLNCFLSGPYNGKIHLIYSARTIQDLIFKVIDLILKNFVHYKNVFLALLSQNPCFIRSEPISDFCDIWKRCGFHHPLNRTLVCCWKLPQLNWYPLIPG